MLFLEQKVGAFDRSLNGREKYNHRSALQVVGDKTGGGGSISSVALKTRVRQPAGYSALSCKWSNVAFNIFPAVTAGDTLGGGKDC